MKLQQEDEIRRERKKIKFGEMLPDDILRMILFQPDPLMQSRLLNRYWHREAVYDKLYHIESIILQILRGNSRTLSFERCHFAIYRAVRDRRGNDVYEIIRNTVPSVPVSIANRESVARNISDVSLYLDSQFVKKKSLHSVYDLCMHHLEI